MPAICAWCGGQPKTNCANSHTTAKGMANERTPISTLARQLAFSEMGSISAPARNVSTPLPSSARKFVHSVDCNTWCRCPVLVLVPAIPICSVPPSSPTARLPAMTPTKISTSATDMPVRIEIRLPMSARPIQTEAINQMFSNIDFFFQQIGRARPPGASAQTVSALSVPPDLTQLYLSIKTPSDWKESLAHAIFPCGKANSIALVDPTGLFASDQSKIERDHTGAGLSISSPHGMLPVHCFRLIAKTSVGNPRKTVCFSSFIPFFSATRRDGTLSG